MYNPVKPFMLFLLITPLAILAQSSQQDINTQVWKPFIKSFNERDTKTFMAIHSRDVVRSPRDSKAVWNWDEYFQSQERGDKRESASKTKRDLQLRFTERLSNKDLAIEVGVYKTVYKMENGQVQNYYGRFHVVLRKENGVWKIVVDTDSSEDNTIGEKDFLTAQKME